ncbi:MAG: metallophosphoesterase [Lachnospiraceae bacterium]|nr:metallophosphoesterase [Lachnospiraceae bacterium]
MIYLTGDTHGSFNRIKNFCKKNKTTKDDVMIILGDAGINYYLGVKDEKNKAFISSLPVTLFCVHGNHEQRPYAIDTYTEIEWRGGTVYVEQQYPNIIFAKDGEIYDFDGKKTIVIGGAYSIDKFYRIIFDYPWFDNEQPSEEIKTYVEAQLEKANWNIDVVLSHTVPIKYEPVEEFIEGIDQSKVDKSTEQWLGEIESKLTYDRWYAGHYHTSKEVDNLVIMFEDYRELKTGNEFIS